MLAHELRNPLAPILSAVQLMRMKPVADPQLSWSRDVIERQLSHLTRLVDDLLDVARITRGKINLSREPIELPTLIARAVEIVQPLIQERGHQFTTEIPDATLRVDADPLRLTQALGNVLGNAAKYTERGGRISLSVRRQGAEVEIRVRDNGIGISAEVLPRIFDLFTQLDRHSHHPHSGLGIGLALVRRLLQMHGGTISAHSEGAGLGSEFVIRLPLLLEATQSANGGPSAATEEPAPVRRRILVADDNVDALQTLATVLELGGHEVFSAANGSLALESAERHLPEVALLDIGMPLLDGYEVARRIRAQAWGKRITLGALTGWGQDSDRRRSREAGFGSHLGKPPGLAQLTGLLARRPARAAAGGGAPAEAPGSKPTPEADRLSAIRRSATGPRTTHEIPGRKRQTQQHDGEYAEQQQHLAREPARLLAAGFHHLIGNPGRVPGERGALGVGRQHHRFALAAHVRRQCGALAAQRLEDRGRR